MRDSWLWKPNFGTFWLTVNHCIHKEWSPFQNVDFGQISCFLGPSQLVIQKVTILLRNMYLSLEYVCPLYKCAIDLLHMWLKVMTVITRNQGVNGRTVSRKRSSTEPDRGDWLGYGTSFITKCWHLVSDKPPFIHE